MPISWLDHKPHAIAVYASWPALPSAHATLATGRPATALPGPVLHRLDCTSFRWRLRKSRLAGQTGPEAQFTFMPAAGWFEQKRLQKDFKYFEAKAEECAAREGIEVDLVVYKQARLLWPVISRGLSYEDRRKILDNLYVSLRACNQKRAINHDTRTREEP